MSPPNFSTLHSQSFLRLNLFFFRAFKIDFWTWGFCIDFTIYEIYPKYGNYFETILDLTKWFYLSSFLFENLDRISRVFCLNSTECGFHFTKSNFSWRSLMESIDPSLRTIGVWVIVMKHLGLSYKMFVNYYGNGRTSFAILSNFTRVNLFLLDITQSAMRKGSTTMTYRLNQGLKGY